MSSQQYRQHVLCAASVVALSVFIGPAEAQTTRAYIVQSCGSPPFAYPPGSAQNILMDITGALCTNASGGGGGSNASVPRELFSVPYTPGMILSETERAALIQSLLAQVQVLLKLLAALQAK